MTDKQPYTLMKDLLKSIVIFFIGCLVVAAILYLFGMNTSEIPDRLLLYCLDSESISLFISILTTFLGVILTVLAILYTFEQNLLKNKTFAILVAHKKHTEIYKRFTDSLFGILWVILLLLGTYFMKLHPNSGLAISQPIKIIYFFVTTTALIFGFIRSWRCFYLFKELMDTMERIKKESGS